MLKTQKNLTDGKSENKVQRRSEGDALCDLEKASDKVPAAELRYCTEVSLEWQGSMLEKSRTCMRVAGKW